MTSTNYPRSLTQHRSTHLLRRLVPSCVRHAGIPMALAAFLCLGAVPASAQVLTPSDPGFWVTLPDGATVPYNHPLAAGGQKQAPAPKSAVRPASPGAVLTPSDPGFWVTLPNGAVVPYNHPAAAGGQNQAPSPAPRPAVRPASPTAVLTPSDPGFWVTLPNGAMVPYNHPDAIAAAAAAPAPAPAPKAAPAPAPKAAPAPSPAPTPDSGTDEQPTAAPRTAPEPEADVAPASAGARLRVLQWNLHHGVGSDGRYDIARIASWMARMKPDVIMLNEVEKNTSWGNEDQPARYEAMLEQSTGRKWYRLFSQEFGNWSANGKGHLILSTFPLESIAREAISYDRVVGSAGINVNGRTINLVITHLDPESHSRRLTQAKEVVAWAGNLAENRILTGDMNAWPDQTSIAELDKSYRDSWTDASSKGTATQFSGLSPDGATKNGRIDYIFYSKGASNLVVLQSQVYDTRNASGAMASDHRPVVTTFEVR
jgi:endonuclease/exonuclease/phosphatase family metal-dependent hydrolase